MKIKGMKELQNQLKNMEKAAKELNGTHNIPFEELFTDSFLRKHTTFTSFDDFENQEIFNKYPTIEEIPDEEMDQFVSAKTNFSNWDDMLGEASVEYAAKKLGF
ncbi:hypothetical protein [Peribacillus asahii]|uniref:hypothetical protein n=1 Tax=Peribacillus asahii TaxID=228899 RepID=UPI0020799E83|nr:hypothetical protein [Peribacillus asahii]USK61299.1 hypothetical protein LIT37_08280 [Peribacillus asahii]